MLIVPEWISDLFFIAVGVGIGYQICKFVEDPKSWLHEWFQ